MKLRLKLSKEQLSKLKKGKNVNIGEAEVKKRGDIELSLCASKNLMRAIDKDKKIRISMGDIIMLKQSKVDDEDDYNEDYEDETYYDGGNVHRRNMRRLKNTFSKPNMAMVSRVGNHLQSGLDKVIPRELQRKAKGKLLDKLDHYVEGMGMMSLPNSSKNQYIPTSYFEPNNIQTINLNRGRRIHGSSFRGPA
jgi:hypothetical protein